MICWVCNSLLNQWAGTSRIALDPNKEEAFGNNATFRLTSALSPSSCYLGFLHGWKRCGTGLWAEATGRQKKGLSLYSLLLCRCEMRKGDRSPAPRLAITEPKLSPARGIVVSMSFQHKINCTAHQPSGSQHLLAASTSSQKEPPRM